MPDVSGFTALDVFIGLAFVFFLLSTVTSALSEAVAGVLQLRWKTLRRGLGELLLFSDTELEDLLKKLEDLRLAVGSKQTVGTMTAEERNGAADQAQMLGLVFPQHADSPLANLVQKIDDLQLQLTQQQQTKKRKVSLRQPEKWAKSWDELQQSPRLQALFKQTGAFGARGPSYIPPRMFALALLDTLAPPVDGSDADVIEQAQRLVASSSCPPALKTWLQDALTEAKGERDKLLASLEKSFDAVMDRVSGWYKRMSTIWIVFFAVLLVGATNADTYAIGQRLWKDEAVRNALVAEAAKLPAGTSCPEGQSDQGQAADGQQDESPLDRAAACVNKVKELGLPFGWAAENRAHSTSQWLGKGGGWLLTVFALMLGAPFWFDTLGKLARLRLTGKREGTLKSDDRTAVDRDER